MFAKTTLSATRVTITRCLKVLITGGTLVYVHPLRPGKGKLVRNTSHSRNRTVSLEELEEKIKNALHSDSLLDSYLHQLHQDKSRYYRDNLTYMDKHHGAFSTAIMHEAFSVCREKGIYNATILVEVAKNLQKESGEKPPVGRETSSFYLGKDYNIMSEKTDINIFNSIFQ